MRNLSGIHFYTSLKALHQTCVEMNAFSGRLGYIRRTKTEPRAKQDVRHISRIPKHQIS